MVYLFYGFGNVWYGWYCDESCVIEPFVLVWYCDAVCGEVCHGSEVRGDDWCTNGLAFEYVHAESFDFAWVHAYV